MSSIAILITDDVPAFAIHVFLTFAALFIAACIIDYIRWRRKQ